MQWTFGIITDGSYPARVAQVIESIRAEAPGPDIVVVGGGPVEQARHCPFDETQKPAWITRKKNLVAEQAEHPNLCLLHDYVALVPGWLAGYEQFGEDWDVCMNRIQNMDGTRFRDWIACDPTWAGFVDYADTSHIHNNTYVSGTYYCVKRDYALAHPLDEKLSWGQGEDVAWSYALRATWNYRFNPHSRVRFLKQKEP